MLWTAAHQAPLPVGFSRQEYWSGLPCASPGDLPNPGIKPGFDYMQILYHLSHSGSSKPKQCYMLIIPQQNWKKKKRKGS